MDLASRHAVPVFRGGPGVETPGWVGGSERGLVPTPCALLSEPCFVTERGVPHDGPTFSGRRAALNREDRDARSVRCSEWLCCRRSADGYQRP